MSRIIDMHMSVERDDPELRRPRLPNMVADPEECTVDNNLRRMDSLRIEKTVVWNIGLSTEECRRNNDFVASVRDAHPDRFIAFATVWPHEGEAAVAEVDRAIGELGMAGIKIHPVVMDIDLDDPRVLAVVERTAELGVSFVSHLNSARLRDLPTASSSVSDPSDERVRSDRADARRLESVVGVFDSPRCQSAHMGGVTSEVVKASNITFQTAGGHQGVIEWAVRELGAHRIVFGSDFPFLDLEDELRKVHDADISEEAREAILWRNAIERVLPDGHRST